MSSQQWRVIGPVAMAVLCLLLPLPAWAEVSVTPAARGYDVDVVGQVSSSEVLDAFATATGIDIKGAPEETTVAETHLRGASLERALRALLPHAGFVVSSDADGKPTAIIFMAASQDGGADVQPDSGVGLGAPAMPENSQTVLPDGGIPNGSAGAVAPADGMSPEMVPQEAPADDGSDEPSPGEAPAGTQGGASGG